MNESQQLLMAVGLLTGLTGLYAPALRHIVRRVPVANPSAEERSRHPPWAMLIVAVWWLLTLSARLFADPATPREVSLSGIQVSGLISISLLWLLAAVLTDGGQRSLADAGMSFANLFPQILLGWQAFLAVIGPTGLLLMLGTLWRSKETQHSYLQALQGESGRVLIPWIALSAVVIAPLLEELLFRVTLQDWLHERVGGPASIGLTAVLFAIIHGWFDALPLLPLSLALGYVYHHTRSYFACVTMHALFNGTNLALAVLSINSGPK